MGKRKSSTDVRDGSKEKRKKSKDRSRSKERSREKSSGKASRKRGKEEIEPPDPSDVPLYPVYQADRENVFASRNAELELV